ncbi:MAG TPA: adenylate/guanylate cyclase domain-containing protein [Methylomirabilota bacterium]|nr:adenylate/guanylate cyclase domain-containing protein [Methylomirabilota bacterium]
MSTRSALEGERKQVTVLFADCVGFTKMSTQLDPEDLHAVMDGAFARIMEAVHRYEGTVNQFTGDGVMALFGAPIAHEDHAVRAVAAALSVQKACREYAETLRQTHGLDFALRIGINTGPVVVGRIGDDLRMDYTAQGETVNLAARLQSAAVAGAVLISEATEALVSGYFVTTDAGLQTVKGIDHPVRAFTVTEQRRRRARFEVAVERGLTPLVDRTRDLDRLVECVERARSGRGQVISVVGDAGVGKSRLLYELRRRLHDRHVLCLEGHCLPHGEALPFHLVAQFLQTNFGLEDGESPAAQAEKVAVGIERLDPALAWTVPYLRHLLGLSADELENEGLDQVQRKRRLIDAVKALTLRGAQHQPLVLLAEDLQWVDRNSEEYCKALVDSVAAHPLVLVFTYRPGYVAPWQDRSFHQRLTIEALSDEETADMVKSLLGVGELSPAVRELIVSRAEGNPFFIEELTRYLRERELHEGAHAGDARVPATVHDLLTARIDRLPDGLKRTLQLAAVLGRDFPLALLERVAPPGIDVKGDVAELVNLELLREKDVFPDLRLSFSHLLVRQVAYDGLLLKTRAEMHARAGAALEALYPGRDIVQDLAEHYAKSPDREKALHYLERASDRAAGLFAYEEAGDYLRRAIDLLPEGEAGMIARARLLGKRGDAAYARGALVEARALWGAALGVVDVVCERRLAADLNRRMGVACWDAGESDEALAHLERGLAALEDDASNIEAARLYQEFGRIYFRRGDHETAMSWAKRALALGTELDAPDVVSHAYNTWGVALGRAGDIEEGARFVARSLETALAHQFGAVACRAYTNLAVMYATIDHQRSLEYCREGLALAQKIGDQLQQSWLYCTLAGGHCTLAGDYDEGVRAAQAAVELDERLGQRNHLPIPLIILAQVYQCRGDYEPSAHYYKRALEVAESVGEPQLLFPCYEGLATLAIERGDEAEAETWLTRSRDVQETTGWSSDTFLVLPFLC